MGRMYRRREGGMGQTVGQMDGPDTPPYWHPDFFAAALKAKSACLPSATFPEPQSLSPKFTGALKISEHFCRVLEEPGTACSQGSPASGGDVPGPPTPRSW